MNITENFTIFENDTYCGINCNDESSILFVLVLYVFGFLTVVFNVPSLVFVILTFFRKLKMKYIHTLSLSITDAVLGVSWLLITSTLGGTKLSFANCASRCYLICVTFMASMFQVLGICIERNLIICLQIKILSEQKKKVSIFTIIIAWGLAIVLSGIVSAVTVRSYHDDRTCSFDSLFQEQKNTAYGTFGIIFAVTQIGVVVAMTTLLVYLIQHQKKMDMLNVRKITKSDLKLCMTIGIIAILFFTVNTPLTVVYIYDGFSTGLSSSRLVRNVCFLFAGINSMINPFIYLFRIEYFRNLRRKGMNQICNCKIKVHPEST